MKQDFATPKAKRKGDQSHAVKELHAKIGELTMERDFLAIGLKLVGIKSGKKMISASPTHPSLSRQSKLLHISRSSLYYRPRGESQETLELMRKIDALYLKYSFFGSRQIKKTLAMEGTHVGRHRIRRLMRLMGLEAIYQKPNTSNPHPEHRIYPYLIKELDIVRANHVWCSDIIYIPVQGGCGHHGLGHAQGLVLVVV